MLKLKLSLHNWILLFNFIYFELNPSLIFALTSYFELKPLLVYINYNLKCEIYSLMI